MHTGNICKVIIIITVFGWLNGTEIFTSESYSETKLEVGFIKGGVVQTFAQLGARNTARFRINITAGSTSKLVKNVLYNMQGNSQNGRV